MDRNLDRRIEAFVPVDDPDARLEIDEIIQTLLSDDRRSWVLSVRRPLAANRAPDGDPRHGRLAADPQGPRGTAIPGSRGAPSRARRPRLARAVGVTENATTESEPKADERESALAAVESGSPEGEPLVTSADAAPDPVVEAPRKLALGAAPSGIEAGDPFGVAGRKAMWVQVHRLLAREAAIRDPAQTDALRRYRVATRRLRSALRFFRDAYGPRETRSLRNNLSDLADALGRVRDLDVRVDAPRRLVARATR